MKSRQHYHQSNNRKWAFADARERKKMSELMQSGLPDLLRGIGLGLAITGFFIGLENWVEERKTEKGKS